MPGIASSSPAVLLAHAASATSTIRVGSGGVMLPNHAPLVVAEQFGMLEALHPGRVDLGIGRAPGTDQLTARALRRTGVLFSEEEFPAQLVELLGYFTGEFPAGHPVRERHRDSGARLPAGAVAARVERLQRAGRRAARACRSRSLTTSRRTTRVARRAGVSRLVPPVRGADRAVRDARRGGHLRRDRRAGAVARRAEPSLVPPPAQRPARPVSDTGRGCRTRVHPDGAGDRPLVDRVERRRHPRSRSAARSTSSSSEPAPTS